MKVQKMSNFVEIGKDIKNGDVVTIENEGEWTGEDAKYGNKLVILLGLVNGEIKKATLNNTTFNTLIDEFGDDTMDWIKQEVRVHIIQTKVGNDFKDVLYLTHPNKDLKGKEINA